MITKIWRGDALTFNYPIAEGGTYVVTALDAASNESAPIIATIPAGDVTVLYQDENGEEVAPSTTIQGNVGETFTITTKKIAGYTLVEPPTLGTFTDQAQTITVSYTKKPEEIDPVQPTDPTKPEETTANPSEKQPNPPAEKASGSQSPTPKITTDPNQVNTVSALPATEQGKLPTTGDKTMDVAIVLGLALSMTGIFILIRRNKRQA
ncbi:Cell wall surface anchor family protein [Listeria grandensis FSL F6-0971]|uniref:Cell wall surface anchor family protein n=1 Tax=Listeria grandensis FSL F6-0971 TaxID=1265819 RepID=W7BD68_9LIST|nr:MucBP domain-containing protein [Listeria grandensis]EUJ22765.1 Cell wall surface anchor family protein [Listeria grandensis FSL F6-0971]